MLHDWITFLFSFSTIYLTMKIGEVELLEIVLCEPAKTHPSAL